MSKSLTMLLPAIGLTLATSVAGAATAVQPRDDRPVAVVMAPWADFGHAATVIAEAGGRIKAAGGVEWIVVTDRGGADFVDALHRAGAWLVIDAEAARGCL